MTDPVRTTEHPPSEQPPTRWPGRAARWLPAVMVGWAIVQVVVFARFGKDLGFGTDVGFGFALFLVTTASTLLLGAFTVLAVRYARASQGEERGGWGLAAAFTPFLLPVVLSFYAVPDYRNTDYVCHRWGFVPASVADAIDATMPMVYLPVVGLVFTLLGGVFLVRATTRRPGLWLLAAVLLAASLVMTGAILHINSCSE